jgi:lysophospholipase L1-like esterase
MTTQPPIWTEATDPYVLSPENGARLLARAPWRRFGVFGDSLSLGVGDATPGYDNLGWPARVERVLRLVHPGLAYLNTARVGATSAQALEEQAERIEDFGPDVLHLNSGANDIIRRTPDWGRIEDDLRAMYEWATSTGAQLSVITLGLTRKLAAEYNAAVADCWDHPLNDRPNLLSEDRIHFATTGQAVIASLMIEALGTRLGNSVTGSENEPRGDAVAPQVPDRDSAGR